MLTAREGERREGGRREGGRREGGRREGEEKEGREERRGGREGGGREGRMGRGSHEESSCYDLLLFNICIQFPCVGSDWLHSHILLHIYFTSLTHTPTMYNRDGYLYTH